MGFLDRLFGKGEKSKDKNSKVDLAIRSDDGFDDLDKLVDPTTGSSSTTVSRSTDQGEVIPDPGATKDIPVDLGTNSEEGSVTVDNPDSQVDPTKVKITVDEFTNQANDVPVAVEEENPEQEEAGDGGLKVKDREKKLLNLTFLGKELYKGFWQILAEATFRTLSIVWNNVKNLIEYYKDNRSKPYESKEIDLNKEDFYPLVNNADDPSIHRGDPDVSPDLIERKSSVEEELFDIQGGATSNPEPSIHTQGAPIGQTEPPSIPQGDATSNPEPSIHTQGAPIDQTEPPSIPQGDATSNPEPSIRTQGAPIDQPEPPYIPQGDATSNPVPSISRTQEDPSQAAPTIRLR